MYLSQNPRTYVLRNDGYLNLLIYLCECKHSRVLRHRSHCIVYIFFEVSRTPSLMLKTGMFLTSEMPLIKRIKRRINFKD